MSRFTWFLCVCMLLPAWFGCPVRTALAATASLDHGLVAWWPLEETSGTTAADASKSGHKGTLVGGLTFERASVPGRIGRALAFDGKGGHVTIEGYRGITGTAPRTVAAWIKTSERRGDVIRWGANDAGKIFRMGFIRGRIGLDPSGGYLYVNDDFADDHWHHVVVVVEKGDPPNLHDHVKLYVDGEPAAIHDIGLLDLWPLDTGDEFDVTIGRGFRGLIDELRIYDRPLSGDEVRLLYKLGSEAK